VDGGRSDRHRKDSAGRFGGAITAAWFIRNFVGETPWAHLDIAGSSNISEGKERGYTNKWGSGVPTRTFVNLALALARTGSRVGILDGDIYGPNVPIMLGLVDAQLGTDGKRIVPAERHGVQVVSMGFLTADDAFEVEAKLPSGETVVYDIERDAGDALGIELEPPSVRRCANRCEFCFVEGLPKGAMSLFELVRL